MSPERAIEHYGSRGALAKACDVTEAAVYLWVKQGAIPYDRQCQIQVDTKGALLAKKEDAEPNERVAA
jgi:hypothetical protein